MLDPSFADRLDALLGRPTTPSAAARYPGARPRRQPVHTVYVPADRFAEHTVAEWGAAALAALRRARPAARRRRRRSRPGCATSWRAEPIEDLRVDFEDGYGVRADDDEDAAARAAAAALGRRRRRPAFVGHPDEVAGGGRPGAAALRTLDLFLERCSARRAAARLPRHAAQGDVGAPGRGDGRALRRARGGATALAGAALRDPDRDAAGGARRRRHRAASRRCCTRPPGAAPGCTTAPTTTAPRSASRRPTRRWSTRRPTTPRRSCRWPRPAPACRCRDGSTNVLPVGDARAGAGGLGAARPAGAGARWSAASTRAGTCTRPSCRPDSPPPTRSTATAPAPRPTRLRRYLRPAASSGMLDEPATARALAGYLLRGLDCGALDPRPTPSCPRFAGS